MHVLPLTSTSVKKRGSASHKQEDKDELLMYCNSIRVNSQG
jgi:hypothetical protein